MRRRVLSRYGAGSFVELNERKPMANIFSGIGSKILKAAEEVKAAVIKAAEEVAGIAGVVQKDAPEITALAQLVYPSAGTLVQGGVALLEEVASVLSQGGTAAESNFLNAGLDQAPINGVKALIADFKSFKK